ncbi:MAG: hypothetical protein ACLU2J_03640 [Clostridia bacterium]|nr:hypothetical protein [Eubacterium ventriosum]
MKNNGYVVKILEESIEDIFELEEKLVSSCGCAQCGGSDKC